MTTPLPPFGVTQQMTRCETFHINIWSCCCRQGKGSGRRLPPALLSGPGSEGADRGPRPRAAPWLVPLSAPSPRPEDCRLLSLTCPLPPNPSAVCGILNKYNFHIAEVRLQNPARGVGTRPSASAAYGFFSRLFLAPRFVWYSLFQPFIVKVECAES